MRRMTPRGAAASNVMREGIASNREAGLKGVVRRFSPEKGYGFITLDGGQDVFVHRDHIRGGTLREGDRVSLDTIDTQKGPAARNVTVEGGVEGAARGRGLGRCERHGRVQRLHAVQPPLLIAATTVKRNPPAQCRGVFFVCG